MSELLLRVTRPGDAAAIQRIYRYYVEKTAITCEVVAPSVTEIQQRIVKTLQKYPYIVAELDKQVVGFAYVGPANPRAAYQWSVETSIYLDHNCRGQHVGSRLYDLLEKLCQALGVVNMLAHITYPREGKEDQYLTLTSPRFHQARGYQQVAHFHQDVYKFDRWYDTLWMQKVIAKHAAAPAPIKNFNDIKSSFFEE